MDAQAFAERYSAIYVDLYRFALCMTGNPADAEDAVGDAVLSAFRSVGQLRNDESFRSWIFQIVANACRKRLRQRTPLADDAAAADVADGPSSRGFDHGDALWVRQALSTLPVDDRIIVALSVVGGYSSAEIGVMLTMNPSSVRSRQKRSLAKLAALMKDVRA